MEESIRMVAVSSFLIIGLSHVLQPKVWIDFFKFLIKLHYTGAFINGFITLPMAVLIISFHNVWTGIPLLLTLMGWAYTIKSIIAFCFPAWGLRSMRRIEKINAREFRIAGCILMMIAIILSTTLL